VGVVELAYPAATASLARSMHSRPFRTRAAGSDRPSAHEVGLVLLDVALVLVAGVPEAEVVPELVHERAGAVERGADRSRERAEADQEVVAVDLGETRAAVNVPSSL